MTIVLGKLAPVSGQALVIVIVGALALSGCGGVKESLGAAKQAPDETAVTTRAPLVVPFHVKTTSFEKSTALKSGISP